MRSPIRHLAAITAAATLAFGVIAPAHATDTPSSDPTAQIREFWTEYGVAPALQDALAAKLESGGNLDSGNAYAEPVSTDTTTSSTMTMTVETFADGSIRVTGIENAPTSTAESSVGTLATGITDCRSYSGTGFVHYTGCRVISANGTQNISFKVDYEKYSHAHAKILRTYSANATSNYGTITDPKRSLWRPQSTASQKAVAKYKSYYESHNGASSETIYLAFWLSSNGTRSAGRS